MKFARLIPVMMLFVLLGATFMSDAAYSAESGSESSAVKDAWLDGKLEAVLLFNQHLNSFDIDTDVRDSVAYLGGTVESDIDRDLAVEIARSIDGITDVKSKLVVDMKSAKAASTSEQAAPNRTLRERVLNATLTARVKTRLLFNNNTEGLGINVDSKAGVVTLSGSVDSDQERELAAKIAGNTTGALKVIDNLVVDPEEAE